MIYEPDQGVDTCMDAPERREIDRHPPTRKPYHYRVVAAQTIRSRRDDTPAVLTVEKIDGTSPVPLDPHQSLIEATGGRSLFTPENTLSDRSLLFVRPPSFPLGDLLGKLIIPLAPFGGPDASLLAVANIEQSGAACG